MKTVKVTIKGTILTCEYASQKFYDEADDIDFDTSYFFTLGWQKIDAMYIDDNEDVNVVKKKGKYVQTRNYFHKLFADDGYYPLPVDVHLCSTGGGDTFSYIINLEDDEEFDIKKVQLINSDYEISPCPYFILVEKIMYDGKEVPLNPDEEEYYGYYGIEGPADEEWVVTEYIHDPEPVK